MRSPDAGGRRAPACPGVTRALERGGRMGVGAGSGTAWRWRSVSGARAPFAPCRVPLNGLRSRRGEHIREMVKQINDIRHHVTF